MRIVLPLLLIVFSTSLVSPLVAQAHVATITTNERKFEDIRITQDDLRKIEGRQGPATRAWDPSKIVKIEYRMAPDSFKKGFSQFEAGEYERASELLSQALQGSTSAYPWLPAYANYYLGQALSRLRDDKAAIAALEKVVAIEPKPRFAPEAYLTLIDLHLREGAEGAPRARKRVDEFAALVKSYKLPDRYNLLASLSGARVELRTGDKKKALASLETLVGAASSLPDVANIVRLEIGNAHLGLKDFTKSEAYFKGIIDSAENNPDPELLAGAFNGLGDSQMALDKYKDALTTYSRTYGLFYERADQRERVAHALYHGARAFEAQAGLEPDPEKKEDMNRRASLLKRRVRSGEFRDTAAGAEALKAQGFGGQ